MKKIETLVSDIYGLFEREVTLPEADTKAFGAKLGDMLAKRLSEKRSGNYLRLSNLGSPCRRKLWYSVNTPGLGEQLSPATRLKFLFGDILEELLFFLARAAGHKVTREQEEVSIDGVVGHIDGFIDDELVDCKSASTNSFQKFKNRELDRSNDAFGYIDQLGAYGHATGSERGHFLVIDKTLGHLTLDTHKQPKVDYDQLVRDTRHVLEQPRPPERSFSDVPDGKSGNRKLGVQCSYCDFKTSCWPGLRKFNYARGPVYLTEVRREPRVEGE